MSKNQLDILILEPDQKLAKELLGYCGSHSTMVVTTVAEAEASLHALHPKLFICEDTLPDLESGIMFFARTMGAWRDPLVWGSTKYVLLTPDITGAVFFRAMEFGGFFDIFIQPLSLQNIRGSIHQALHNPTHAGTDVTGVVTSNPKLEYYKVVPTNLNTGGLAAKALIGGMAMTGIFFGLYDLKCDLGIDIFPNWHLVDILSGTLPF